MSNESSSEAFRSAIAQAVATLQAGELVVFPTETFYGIAADPESSDALEKIVAIKGREPDKPIALIAADMDAAFSVASHVPETARKLARAFWPGPLTLVLPARSGLHDALKGPNGVGVRVSPHPVARALSAAFGKPITATSANLSGTPAIADALQVREVFAGRIKVILEDGRLAGGAPSTVVEFTESGYRIVREGAVSAAAIAQVIAT
ncbi:MAG TPA: L-threonylcarbamoyladenylate synthase [Candidatus Binataceae bacterium]|nr:L-threonylcarbamoyladenylate synthase [Candidatus Binataceae bacterium]